MASAASTPAETRAKRVSMPRGGARRGDGASRPGSETVSALLGWFSIGLGVAELLAPRQVAQAIGVRNVAANRRWVQAMGARELAVGAGVLLQPGNPFWLWARTAGDAMDLGMLAAAAGQRGADPRRLAAAALSVAAIAAFDAGTGRQLQRRREGPTRVVNTLIIDATPEVLYQHWRDFEKLPRFMHHLDRVEVQDERHSHWVAKAPGGVSVEWDAEIVEDRPNELLAWRSLPGADVQSFGRVEFRPTPGGRGTKVRVETRYTLPLGALGTLAARLSAHAPEQEIQQSLRALKQMIETGEILRSDAAPGGPPRPASPNPEFARAQIDTRV